MSTRYHKMQTDKVVPGARVRTEEADVIGIVQQARPVWDTYGVYVKVRWDDGRNGYYPIAWLREEYPS